MFVGKQCWSYHKAFPVSSMRAGSTHSVLRTLYMLSPFHYFAYHARSMISQIPFAPEDVSVSVVSGSRLEVFFCDPLISSGDIWGFLVQWDTDEDFENAIEGDDTGAGCYENGYGSCVVQDAAIAGQCPYSLVLTGLTEGEASIPCPYA